MGSLTPESSQGLVGAELGMLGGCFFYTEVGRPGAELHTDVKLRNIRMPGRSRGD